MTERCANIWGWKPSEWACLHSCAWMIGQQWNLYWKMICYIYIIFITLFYLKLAPLPSFDCNLFGGGGWLSFVMWGVYTHTCGSYLKVFNLFLKSFQKWVFSERKSCARSRLWMWRNLRSQRLFSSEQDVVASDLPLPGGHAPFGSCSSSSSNSSKYRK